MVVQLRFFKFGFTSIYSFNLCKKKTCIVFLVRVLRRVVRLLSLSSVLEASNEASLRQARNVSEECEQLMDENKKLKKVMLKGM